MNRGDLLRELTKRGWVRIRRGARHDWYQNPRTRVCQPVPRHQDVEEALAKHILKMLADAQ
jgi:predicted RNA binding protein YcfA (HicA-like mRNA interferase family)